MTRALPTPHSAEHLQALARRAPGGSRDGITGMMIDYGEWVPVALYPVTTEGGAGVLVSVSRAPAMFYRITCDRLGIDLSTGSGCHELADSLATALAGDMLGPVTDEEPALCPPA